MTLPLIGFAFVLLLAFVGLPLTFALVIVGLAGYAFLRGIDPALAMMANQIFDVSTNFSLSVLPMFILMGLFIMRSNISEELYEATNSWVGHRRGGLAHATILACGIFGAITGSSIATAATMSKIAINPMRRYGYDDSLSTGSIASGGVLAALIPPSVPLIVYGILTQTDILLLFIGTIVPGVLLVVLFLVAIYLTIKVKPELGPRGERIPMRERIRLLKGLWGILILFVIVLGGMYGGIFTVIEAASIGAFGAFLIAVVRRRLTFKVLLDCLIETTKTTTMIFCVLFGAMIFSNFIALSGMSEHLVSLINSYDLGPVGVLLVIGVIYIVLGCVMESMSLLVLTAPIFLSIVSQMGVNAVWFGIFVVMMIEVGMISPPVGLNVFTVKAVHPSIPLNTIFKGTSIFMAAGLLMAVILIAFPSLVLLPVAWLG